MVEHHKRLFLLLPLLLSVATFGKTELVRRKNLDYLDADALRYYLDETTVCSYDVAVMFYAQRDKNSHRIAPVWDKISSLLKAGTKDSNLIVALFDCEANDEHLELCHHARVATYPEFAYASLAANHTLVWKGRPRHVALYPGSNWQQGDAILDWLKAMKALSKWHRSGWSQRLRRMVLPFLKVPDKSTTTESRELPLGAPKEEMEKKELAELKKTSKAHQALATRSDGLVEALLFPPTEAGAPLVPNSDGKKQYTDVFAWITAEKGWDSKVPRDIVLRSCAIELASDFCERSSTRFMEDWIEALPPGKVTLTQTELEGFQTNLTNFLNETEPFCAIIDDCVAGNFTESDCRPTECPFQDTMACRYLTSCLHTSLQNDYAQALNLDSTTDTATTSDQSASTSKTSAKEDRSSTKKTQNKPFSWGL